MQGFYAYVVFTEFKCAYHSTIGLCSFQVLKMEATAKDEQDFLHEAEHLQ